MLTLASCSKNDDPVAPQTTPPVDSTGDNIVTTFMNLTASNSWAYNTGLVIGTSPATVPTPGTVTLNVGGDYNFGGFAYKTMIATPSPISGFYCNQLNTNHLRIDGSSIKMTGKFKFSIGTATNLEFPVTDFVIFKENAALGAPLGPPTSGTTPFPVVISPTNTLNVDVNYTVSAVAGEFSASKTFVSGLTTKTYNNVKKVIITIAIKASTVINGGQIELLDPPVQPVIISEQYYAKDLGMVDALTTVKYSLGQALASNLPAGTPASEIRTFTDKLQ